MYLKVNCSQSPIFPCDFRDSYATIELPPSWFVTASKTCTLTRDPLGGLDTLPRLRSPLQTKMAAGVRFLCSEQSNLKGSLANLEQDNLKEM